MKDENARGPERPSDDVMSAMLALWLLPAAFSVSWWKVGLNLLQLSVPRPCHHGHRDEQGQLVVPEPIENDGEHALFA